MSGESIRFLAVLVIATPCPLLLAIPIAIIGSISLCARRAIIVKSPVVLEQIAGCRTAIFDKTGTLTYGEPKLTEQLIAPDFAQREVLDPRGESRTLLQASAGPRDPRGGNGERLPPPEATEVSEPPGEGLARNRRRPQVQITSRGKFTAQDPAGADRFLRSRRTRVRGRDRPALRGGIPLS